MNKSAGSLLVAAAVVVCSVATATPRAVTGVGALQNAPVLGGSAARESLVNGLYSQAQALRGKSIYLDECARCHSETLGGTEFGPAVVGDEFVSQWTGKSVGELFARIRETMPIDSPGRLSAARTADIVAFILKSNDYPAGEQALGSDMELLRNIRLKASAPDRH